MIIGITGSIGSGKTTVSGFFKDYGIAVQNADAVVHDLYKKDTKVIREIEKICPESVLEDGKTSQKFLDRALLSTFLRENPSQKERIESVVHPAVEACRKRFIEKNKTCVLDIPLLIEKDIHLLCDEIVVIVCEDAIRKHRVMQRGVSEEKFAFLDALQMPQDKKIAYATKVFSSDKPLEVLQKEVFSYIEKLKI